MSTQVCRAAIYLLIFCGCALTPRTAAAEWRRLDSPNFIVIGDVSARELREVAVQFEGFRETLSRVLSARATATAVPTVVIVFPSDRVFTPYKPVFNGKPVNVGGVFYADRDYNYITLLRDGRPDSMRIVFHEYAHLVISNVAMNLPAWLNEGLAEHYSTYEYSRGGREAMIGRPIESHLRLLERVRLLPLQELIAVDHQSPLYNEGERRSVFYAQSWALTHMLLLGDTPRVKELSAFVNHLQEGIAEAEAWTRAFGDARIEQELERYLRRQTVRVYTFTFPERLTSFSAEAVTLSPAEVAGYLAGLRIRQQRLDEAETLLGGSGGSGHPLHTIARARLDLARHDAAGAAARLLALGDVQDWFAAYTAGAALTTLLERSDERSADRIDRARGYLEAVRTRRELPNALAQLALLDVLSPGPLSPDALKTIVQARTLAPGRDDYALIHARMLALIGEFGLARQILSALAAPGFPDHIRSTANAWLSNVARMEAARRTVAERQTRPAPSERAEAFEASDTPAATPARVIPVFRKLESGEQQLEGTLVQIDCPARPPVTFQIEADAGRESFQAPSLSVVDFITYRHDLTGGVSCGAQKPMRVLLTWRTGAAPSERIVVAIEFLPPPN